MRRLFAIALSALFLAPAAQAQDWRYPNPADDDRCYALTTVGDVRIGFQAGNGPLFKAYVPGPVSPSGAGDAFVSFGAPGPLGGQHIASLFAGDRGTEVTLDVARFSDFYRFPDRFRIKIWRGKQVLADTEITGFTAALANIRKCVAARG